MTNKDYALLALLFVLVLVFPFATVWSLNMLFLANIPYTVETYFAALWINFVFGGGLFQRATKK